MPLGGKYLYWSCLIWSPRVFEIRAINARPWNEWMSLPKMGVFEMMSLE